MNSPLVVCKCHIKGLFSPGGRCLIRLGCLSWFSGCCGLCTTPPFNFRCRSKVFSNAYNSNDYVCTKSLAPVCPGFLRTELAYPTGQRNLARRDEDFPFWVPHSLCCCHGSNVGDMAGAGILCISELDRRHPKHGFDEEIQGICVKGPVILTEILWNGESI